MPTRRRFLHLAGVTAVAPISLQSAWSLDYPTRPVRIIVAFVPGGPSDIFGRIAAQKLSEQFGKQFYVENISGGGGNIAAAQAARAAPDGHTILVTVSAFVTNPAFLGKAPFDPIRDVAPAAVPLAPAIPIVVTPPSGVAAPSQTN